MHYTGMCLRFGNKWNKKTVPDFNVHEKTNLKTNKRSTMNSLFI